MQVFIIGSIYDTIEILDKKRFNKQIIECKQILKAINGEKAWKNHPVTKEYEKYVNWLSLYLGTFELYNIGDKDKAKILSDKADKIKPPFHTIDFFNQMKRRLYTKDNIFYSQWSFLGESEINWYYVDNQWKFYKNGKLIKN